MIAKKSNWGPRSRLKMNMKAGRMVVPPHYFTLVSEKVEIVKIALILRISFFVKFDHELARTSELDVLWPSPPHYLPCAQWNTTIRTVKSVNSVNKK